MDERRRFSPPVVGGSSLLVIFAVLCLTVFALLALSTVQADGRLSQKMAQSVKEYYAADSDAEEIFARLRAGERPEYVTQNGDAYSYACPMSDTQRLCVKVCRDGEQWTVQCWQVQSTVDWENDESLNVWDGT